MTLRTSGLKPGYAVTVWWVFFNNPSPCHGDAFGPLPKTLRCGVSDLKNPAVKGSVQFAAGAVANAHGNASFTASLAVGTKTTCAGPPFPCHGLLSATRSEIVLLVRSHGPVTSKLKAEETSTYNGGCNAGETNAGKCDTVQFSPHETAKAVGK